VPSAVIRGSNESEHFWCHRGVKVLHSVTVCVTSISFPGCHSCEISYTCLKYHCHVLVVGRRQKLVLSPQPALEIKQLCLELKKKVENNVIFFYRTFPEFM
jgi:hypothetical protein